MVLRLVPFFDLGETAGPIIMFFIPVTFYIVLAVEGISFDEVNIMYRYIFVSPQQIRTLCCFYLHIFAFLI